MIYTEEGKSQSGQSNSMHFIVGQLECCICPGLLSCGVGMLKYTHSSNSCVAHLQDDEFDDEEEEDDQRSVLVCHYKGKQRYVVRSKSFSLSCVAGM